MYGIVHSTTKGSQMSEPEQPPTQTIAASEARQRWADLLNQVFRREVRVIIEKSGLPAAALISADDLARLIRFDEERAMRFQALDASRAAFAGVPDDEIEREVARAVEEARAKIRRQDGPAARSA